MRRELLMIFSLLTPFLLIATPASLLAKSSNSTPWSQVISEGKKLIEEKLNLSGTSFKISFITSSNVTFSAIVSPSGNKIQVKGVVLLYLLSEASGRSKYTFPVMASFKKEQGKLLPIGVQVVNGNVFQMERNWKGMVETTNPIVAAQIPSVCPNWESMFNWRHLITYSMKLPNIPSQLSSKLSPSRNSLQIVEKVLEKYSKVWWGLAPSRAAVNTSLYFFDWASTKYLSEIPLYGVYGSFGNSPPVLFPQESTGSFSVYDAYTQYSCNGTIPPGWEIYGFFLTKEKMPLYINLWFSGTGPGNTTHLPSNLSEVKSSVKKAFLEELQGLAHQIGSARMIKFYQDLLNNGSAYLGGQEYVISESVQGNNTSEKAVISIGGKNSAIMAFLTLRIYLLSSMGQVKSFGSFFFVVNDWSAIFPKKVVNYGGYEKALEVAKESLGSKADQVISEKIAAERGILWANKVYKVYFVKTEVKSGLTSEKSYIVEVFLGKDIDTQLIGTSSLSASQIVILDWYLIFPPIIGAGCAIGGAAYWRYRKKRRQVRGEKRILIVFSPPLELSLCSSCMGDKLSHIL